MTLVTLCCYAISTFFTDRYQFINTLIYQHTYLSGWVKGSPYKSTKFPYLLYKVPGAMIHKRRLIVSYENVIKHIQVNTASLIYIYKLICSCCASLWTILTRSYLSHECTPVHTLYIHDLHALFFFIIYSFIPSFGV